MVEQIRNDDMVEILRPDFFARYEPNAAMVHAGLHLQLPQLRGYWPMSSVDENGDVYDLSDQGRMLTNHDNTPFLIYNLLPYADFIPNDYLSRADEAGLDIIGALTLGGWFWFDAGSIGNQVGLMSKWEQTLGNQRAYGIFKQAANTITAAFSGNGIASTTVTTAGTVSVSTWYHIVGRYTPSTSIEIFVDGIKTTNAVATPAALFNSTEYLAVGCWNRTLYLDGRACQCFLCAQDLPDVIITTIYEQTRANFGK